MTDICHVQTLQLGNGRVVTLHQHLLHGVLLVLWRCGEGDVQLAHMFGEGNEGLEPGKQISIHPPPLSLPY